MDTQRVRFLRELLVTDNIGNATTAMVFSYDSGVERDPHFFGVPEEDQAVARHLYQQWGGERPEGYRRGTTARKP